MIFKRKVILDNKLTNQLLFKLKIFVFKDSICDKMVTKSSANKKHIMISYNSGSRDMCLKIKEELKVLILELKKNMKNKR